MITILRLDEHYEYKDIINNIYYESFPPYERWDFEILNKRQYEKPFDVYAITDDGNAIGIYVPWTFDDFIFIEFIAIDKKCRGKNYGSVFLKYILDQVDKNVVIEVEPSEVSDMAKKRIEWYTRFGFIMSNEKYAMPNLDNINKQFIDMKIMTTKAISKIEFENINKILLKDVYDIKS